ncbi:phosphatase [Alkalibacter saccharofermentans]|uniref:Exopolyphosphatase / guanosine-5'-triphosphate,3'-diphosphate pyrophosphatase n=1 Tax=Alkalibacter saccharofermentans DSM 14828 TaxID=1120975 RepID=A0A1M4SF33_9FIRM|nr:phosphatase [Alkalibacter saccharofermentans]SHE30874.1 exopolyphosphatase / guanosine-5'-triphosphate,3'-diphosphate pyrophosphatase [Alkalibacter saccharofermentans DSM 14828]
MIYALVDVGSNTMRMNIYKCEEHSIKLLFGTKNPAGLAGYVENGSMSQKGIKKAISVLMEFKSIVDNFDIDELYVFATASLRNIDNSEDAVDQIQNKTGLNIDVISGEDEAILDFIGATKVVDVTDGLIVDIGGGSTELVTFENKKIINAISIPIGSLNLYKKCVSQLLPDKKEKKLIRDTIKSELEDIGEIINKPYKIICGVGGTVRATKKLNNSIYDLPDENIEIDIKNIKKILKILSKNSRDSLDAILQVVPDRIHTIIPGMMILNEVSKVFKSDQIVVSSYGVREGYLYDKILKEKALYGKP